MKLCHIFTLVISLVLFASCTRKKETAVEVSATPAAANMVNQPPRKVLSPQEKSAALFVHLMEQADSVHREAWWVLTNERRALLKSPFGKVQRAILSQGNAKLGNKSLFRCDRYEVKRDVMSQTGYPQKIEMYEKCSAKSPAKHMAMLYAKNDTEFDLTFYPEGLEEVLGIGAAILNKTITCHVRTNANEQLLVLNCKDWAQEKNKEQMIRLDVYDYQKEGQDMIKLVGKLYENLTDIRKIEASVPMTGKITVTETELYAPTPSPTPKPTPTPQKPAVAGQPPTEGQQQPAAAAKTGEPVSVPLDQETYDLPGGVIGGVGQGASDAAPPPTAADQGWPTDEQGNVIENPQPLENDGDSSQDGAPAGEAQPEQPQILHDQGAPSGR
ncbi:hypothetical protein ACLVWU_10550 [Bdellovibrio sp. HCB290]|uniref:hypothetical protein n=1 Tax=Bdellovibrio sp. HCB290 TaxID=3394356 RepID=UPI0039B63586